MHARRRDRQLDDEAIFYLRARGLTFAEARDMLIHRLCRQVLDGVQIPALRDALEAELFDQLAKTSRKSTAQKSMVARTAKRGGGADRRAAAAPSANSTSAESARNFPSEKRQIHGKPLVYSTTPRRRRSRRRS